MTWSDIGSAHLLRHMWILVWARDEPSQYHAMSPRSLALGSLSVWMLLHCITFYRAAVSRFLRLQLSCLVQGRFKMGDNKIWFFFLAGYPIHWYRNENEIRSSNSWKFWPWSGKKKRCSTYFFLKNQNNFYQITRMLTPQKRPVVGLGYILRSPVLAWEKATKSWSRSVLWKRSIRFVALDRVSD